ncbi:MAG TPA: ornithine carbamoyltransferase [Acidobacteriota bacterium]|nr:ornithine carbamoyltransferase [Acidobacteriota bacterium]
MKGKDLISIHDLSLEEIEEIFNLASKMKDTPADYSESLAGKTLGMIFQKPSTRTRVSFEVGIYQLGGIGLYLSSNDLQLGRGETIADTARVLSRFVDAVMARVFAHQDIIDLARYCDIPVINGLTDLLHPCQALADFLTIREHKGELKGLKLAYIGDGNNVAHSLLYTGAKLGTDVSIICPPGYEPNEDVVKQAREDAKVSGARLEVTNDIAAVEGVDAVYTDVWTSMGQEAEAEERKRILQPYQVNSALMKRAGSGAIFLHCLPAHRGEEVTDEVADSPASVIFDEAENRLHAQKAIMYLLMRDR